MRDELARILTPDLALAIRAAPFEVVREHFWEPIVEDLGDEGSAWLGEVDRYYLLTVLLRREDAINPWIYARCREVEASRDGHLDLWAREHYKSTVITFAGSFQEIIEDQEITIGIFSHTSPVAKAFVNQIKQELETNQRLIELYPHIFWEHPKRDAPKWSLDDGLCVRRNSNPKEQTVEGHGLVDGMPTSKHFKLRLYDDVVTKASVATPEQVKKTTEAWSLSNALGAGEEREDGTIGPGREQTVGTRYSYADTYQAMIEMRAVKMRTHAATDNGRRDGVPVFFSKERWDDKLLKMLPSVLAAQMLQNPAAGNEAMFQAAWLKFTDIRPKTLNIYIVVDPANSKKKESDRTAMGVIGVDAGRNKYFLDGYDHKMNLRERWQNLKNLWERWSKEPGVQMVKVGYERYGMQSDLEYFEERMEIEEIHFDIQEVAWPIEGPGSKEDRIERLVPDFMQGKFFLTAIQEKGPDEQFIESKNQRRCREAGEAYRILKVVMRRDHEGSAYSLNKNFIEQFRVFPFAPKKDLLDACSRIYDLDPQPPIIIDERELEPPVFADGI